MPALDCLSNLNLMRDCTSSLGIFELQIDPDIHFKHTEGVAKTGQINYVERVTRESKFYDPEKKKNLLMKAMLPDARPLINVNPGNGPLVVVQLLDDECPEDFTRLRDYWLLETRSNCSFYILPRPLMLYLPMVFLWLLEKGYGQNVNPGNGPLVVVQLLDDECPEDFINLSVLSFQRILLWCNVERCVLLETRQFLCIYIAKATGIVAAYGFPEVVGERLDPDIHFMYIEGAAKTGQIKDVKVSYPLPCMPTICFDILKDMAKKLNPRNAPLVVVQLLDDECPEDFVKVLLYLSVLSFQRILFVEQCENRRLRDASYLKRDELLRIYISKATGIVAADGFPVVVGERLDLDIHFMYIEGAAKTGQIKDVKVNPGNAPFVVVQLCDDECPEDFIKVLLYLSVLSFQMILLFSNVRRDDPLVEQCEKRLRDASYLKRDLIAVAAKEYPQELGVNACIRLFEQFKSYEGSYFFLWTYLCSRLDPDIHFMYIEGAAKTGQIKDVKVERRELVETRRIAAYILRRPLAAKEYPQPLGVDACIRLFEQFKSYEGSYFFLGTYLSSRLDPDIHFKHIEGAAKNG
ncbi:hypothetical protein H6P81_021684 [Aristolochia fimbriata]|uniref:Uncharacterized protein n=1 Tax=Aristolochia fimbriata TaxID=158543 RepID=A0AAV7DT07_ARIFI|nr:hypothetical protein H6P81_021684 [Aristolochia fimbriata]